MNELQLIMRLLHRELLIYCRSPMTILNPLLFFMLVITLITLGLDLQAQQLKLIAPALVWVSALLAILLTSDFPLKNDEDDGSLLQLMLAPVSFYMIIISKIIAYWCISGLPIILLTPLMGLLLNIPTDVLNVLLLTLLMGTPILCALGFLLSSLLLRVQQSGLLLQILISVLQIPTLIFATTIVSQFTQGFSIDNEIMLLSALLLITLTLAPLAAMGILKVIVE